MTPKMFDDAEGNSTLPRGAILWAFGCCWRPLSGRLHCALAMESEVARANRPRASRWAHTCTKIASASCCLLKRWRKCSKVVYAGSLAEARPVRGSLGTTAGLAPLFQSEIVQVMTQPGSAALVTPQRGRGPPSVFLRRVVRRYDHLQLRTRHHSVHFGQTPLRPRQLRQAPKTQKTRLLVHCSSRAPAHAYFTAAGGIGCFCLN